MDLSGVKFRLMMHLKHKHLAIKSHLAYINTEFEVEDWKKQINKERLEAALNELEDEGKITITEHKRGNRIVELVRITDKGELDGF